MKLEFAKRHQRPAVLERGTLVGPDCRRFLDEHVEILEDARVGMVRRGHSAADSDFVKMHTRVLAPLAVVSRITRRVNGAGANGLLLEADQTELIAACSEFGRAWRESYERKLTPKGHIAEVRVPQFVRWYEACGVFGEDGVEALHVLDSACRRVVRCMRNPEARKEAQDLHHAARVATPDLVREIRSRMSKKKKNSCSGNSRRVCKRRGTLEGRWCWWQ
jgi:hypothetical protein